MQTLGAFLGPTLKHPQVYYDYPSLVSICWLLILSRDKRPFYEICHCLLMLSTDETVYLVSLIWNKMASQKKSEQVMGLRQQTMLLWFLLPLTPSGVHCFASCPWGLCKSNALLGRRMSERAFKITIEKPDGDEKSVDNITTVLFNFLYPSNQHSLW